MNYKTATIAELEKFIEEQTPICDKKMKEAFDAPNVQEFQRLQYLACKPIEDATMYLKAKKLLEDIVMTPHEKYGSLMELDDFVENVRHGNFIDYDGSGYYSTATEESNISIHPSEVSQGIYRKDFTHVKWYNR